MAGRLSNLTFEDARIMFRNFSGKEGDFNKAGDRNFCLILDFDAAEKMQSDGWNIKYLKPREDGDEPQPYIQVAVSYNPKARPPRVVMVTSRGKTPLGEDEVDILDWVQIENVDLIISPYEWEVSGKTGVKAYLQSIFITIVEDELEQKYGDVPDSASSSMVSHASPSFDG